MSLTYTALKAQADEYLDDARESNRQELHAQDRKVRGAHHRNAQRCYRRAFKTMQLAAEVWQAGVDEPDATVARILKGCTCGTGDDSDHARDCNWHV